ncbi:MAG TPA: hypothetical protein VNE00_06275 [Paraburkholderia sp.]|jgi:hypothetical protein|nr:hypothetical protein [Paraburkholderia sp.]
MLSKEDLNRAAATISFVTAKATKHILKYGAANQLTDILNGTPSRQSGVKFEGEERVKVIRDYLSQAGVYLNNPAYGIGEMDRGAFETGFSAMLAAYYRAGNCGENSAVAFCLLEQLAHASPLKDWLLANNVSLQYWRLATTGDHSFCVIRLECVDTATPMEIDLGPNAMEIDDERPIVIAVQSDPIICDPWAKEKHAIDVDNFFMNNQREIFSLASSTLDALQSSLSEKFRLNPETGRSLNLMELSFNVFCSLVTSDNKNPSTYLKNKKAIAGAPRAPTGDEWHTLHPARDERALLTFEEENLNFDAVPGQKQFAITLYENLIRYHRHVYSVLINYVAHGSLFYPYAIN